MTESSGAGNVAASSVARRDDRFGEAERIDRTDQPVHLRVDRGRHPWVDVAQRRDGDAVGEVEIGAPVGVEQAMALAVAPLTLEIAPQHGREVRAVSIVRVYRLGPAASTVTAAYHDAHGRLHPHRRAQARPRQRPRLRRGRDPALHPRVGRERRGPSRGLRQDGRARLPRGADPRGLRRRRDGLHQLRPAVRGAGAGRHRVPGRPERPCRAQLARRSSSGAPRSSGSAASCRRHAARSWPRSG